MTPPEPHGVEVAAERVWRAIEAGNVDPVKEITLAILAEREACAQTVDDYASQWTSGRDKSVAKCCAAVIRKRTRPA